MAYKNTIEKEHAFKLIDKDIKSDRLNKLLLFYGEEQYLVNWAVQTIIQKYVNDVCKDLNFSKLEGNTVTIDEIKNHCETLPIMSDHRIVLVSDFDVLDGKKAKGFKEEDEKILIEYFKEIPESCILILTSNTVDKRKKLYKSISENGMIYEFTKLDEKLLKAFISKKFKEAEKIVKANIIDELMDMSGYYDKDTDYTLYHLENDIKKIIAYNIGPEIMTSDMTSLVSGNINTDIFAMIESVSKERRDEALQLLHNLFVYGEKEYKILALICNQFELILSIKEMKEEGRSFGEMVKLLGIHEFRIKKASAYAERYTLSQLRRILLKAYEVDKNIKTGLLEPSLALEIFITEI